MSGPRVLSVPDEHTYVDHVRHPSVTGSTRVAQPSAPGWAPPQALGQRWVAEHADTFDVVHLHFGFESFSPEHLARWVDDLHDRGKRLVCTVHDLRNPHEVDPRGHDRRLDVLMPGADALLTLTPGAAAEMRRRWGVVADVLPHPHVVPERWLREPRPAHDGYRVGVHLKSLRPNVIPLPMLSWLVAAVNDLPAASLVVDLHDELLRRDFVRHDAELVAFVRAADARGDLVLSVHERFEDDQLWRYLLGLDLSVVPYAFGTHSGWVEACHDLGTSVLAPRTGHWHEQHRCVGFDAGDEGSLRTAVRWAYENRPHRRAQVDTRLQQRAEVARAHDDVYRRVMRP